MPSHSKGKDLSKCAKEAAEDWLKDCIGAHFDVGSYISDRHQVSRRDKEGEGTHYSMSLAQQCEYAW